MLVNRASIPIATFAALALFQRKLEHTEFEKFLLILSLSQWFLAFGFQWQKNVVVRFYYFSEYIKISKIVFWAASTLLAAAFLVVTYYVTNGEIATAACTLLILSGLQYYYSTNYRMTGSVRTYAHLDTAFQVLRWVGGALLVFVISDHSAPYWGMSFVVLMACLLFQKLWRDTGTHQDVTSSSNKLTFALYLRVGAWLAAFDFAGAGMMYVDRFYVKDAAYILHSTIGNQVGSVLFGALVAATYPRVTAAFAKGDDWRSELRRMIRYAPFLAAGSVISCIVAGPILLSILSPGIHVDLATLALHALSQCAHYVIVLTCIPFLLFHKNYVPTIVYSIFLAAFVAAVYVYGGDNWIIISSIRCIVLFGALALIYLLSRDQALK